MKTAIATTTTTLFIALTLMGCGGTAQLVRKDVGGGQVALKGAFMPAMGDARLLMAEYCNGRFDAVEQHEAVSFRCRKRSTQPNYEVSPALAAKSAQSF